jgi:hypothetical protein
VANVRSGNSHYVDSTGVLASNDVRIVAVVVTATAANAIVAIGDEAGTTDKLNLRVATSGASQVFDFSSTPIYFPNGVKVTTLTNAIATVIYN